ncbi:hydroxyphenylacetyl-CoA thioesterase PaaI [Deinococcus sp. HMF7604]|uniref:hydroxyphenylacetyl-CoA thioesterase PaaI n=1 Tax=Deinococcus betulae TaxID=2873312 RepID=UPI001CCA43AB|nr:hydroxyphenylacetyl-CoA thioesterase PaaI [Deinococcus betulae]MBZ9749949.1 hydroxyphenylacetyl-CoA thioesterase PaaI [Deinococcus betulae]
MSYAAHLGLTVQEASPELTRVTVTVGHAGLNMHGSAHGGLLFSLADEALAVISNLDAQAVAIETHLSFFRAARPGDALMALATPERVGRTLATYRVEIRRETDWELMALFQGTVSRREKK